MTKPIGIFDSGSGGLTILDASAKALPDQSFIYLGDHFSAPYGHRTQGEIYNFTKVMLSNLFRMHVSLVILACNTVSAIALRRIQEEWLPQYYPGRRVLGVLVPTVEALTGLDWDRHNPGRSKLPKKTVGVFATEMTVKSGAYPHQVQLRAPDFEVFQQACPGLVAAIEADGREDFLKDMVSGYCRDLLKQMGKKKLDAVLLGCTHYPLVETFFREALPKGVEIISQPDIVAKSLKAYLERHPEFQSKPPQELRFLTTGDPNRLIHLEKFIPDRKIQFRSH